METASIKRIPSFPGIGLTTRKLVDLLQSTKSDRISDEELTAACGKNTRDNGKGGGAGALASAIRYVLNHDGKVWARERGVASIKLLDDVERAELPSAARRSVNRKFRRELRKADTVDRSKLNDRTRKLFEAECAQMTFAAHAMSANTIKKLEARSATTPEEVLKMLEALK